ncbi:MAG: CAP domain-containing protein [Bacteroidales bacterium]
MKIKKTIKYTFLLTNALFFIGFLSVNASSVTKEEIIDLTNKERETAKLNPLVESEVLDKAAFLKAQDMIGNNYFSHISPEGVDPWHWFDEAGYPYKYAGENLAMDFRSASSVHQAWMKSETHKENIMSSKFQEIGVAVISGIMNGRETRVAVQLFGARISGLDKNPTINVEQVKGEAENSIEMKIIKASVNPWEGSSGDEMLVFAEIEGQPQSVELLIGDRNYDLEKLREDVYMNLVSLKEVNLSHDQLVIKAMNNEDDSIFYQIPKEDLEGYLVKKEGGNINNEESEEKLTFIGSNETDDRMNRLSEFLYPFSSNNLLIVIMGVFLVTVANVWILEKEEEKLLREAKVI